MATVELWHWIAFGVFLVAVLVLDLGVFHRHSREMTLREAGVWTAIWCTLALLFNGLLYAWQGRQAASEFLTGYLIEWALSMDNVFVFAVIFGYFRVPLKYQYRVLFWGILAAVLLRMSFILVGTGAVQYGIVVLGFGLFLIYTGIKLAFQDEAPEMENNIVVRWTRRIFRVSLGDHGDKFFVRENGALMVTPLFIVLIVVNVIDVMFAVDSVPAIIAVVSRHEPYFQFVVFTSNVFAILGLRALYFLLAGIMDMFRYLNYGLSAILCFVGGKMIVEQVFGHPDQWPANWIWPPEPGQTVEHHGEHIITPEVSLVVIVSILAIAIAASVVVKRREDRLLASGKHQPAEPPPQPAEHT
ncbi:MAG: TerC family protein [Pirellulales bacterium]|nr:TerC family protein [Pirellulales bacterium]